MACHSSSNECLLAAGTALAIRIAQSHTAEEVELLGAFFTTLGDQLILLSLGKNAEVPCPSKKHSGC